MRTDRQEAYPTYFNLHVVVPVGELLLQFQLLLQQRVDRIARLLLGIESFTQQFSVDLLIGRVVLRCEYLAFRYWNQRNCEKS